MKELHTFLPDTPHKDVITAWLGSRVIDPTTVQKVIIKDNDPFLYAWVEVVRRNKMPQTLVAEFGFPQEFNYSTAQQVMQLSPSRESDAELIALVRSFEV